MNPVENDRVDANIFTTIFYSIHLIKNPAIKVPSTLQVNQIPEFFFNFHKRKTPAICKGFESLRKSKDYLFENCDALLAFLRPGFFLSFILESLVRKPAALSIAL